MEAHLSVSTMFFVLQNVVQSIQEQEGQRSRCTVTSPHCVHTAGNSVYFVSAAAVRTEDTNKNYAVWNVRIILYFLTTC